MPKRFDPFTAWFQTSIAMNSAITTIAMRAFRMQQAIALGDASGGPEARRMTREKWIAASDGYFKGAKAMTALMLAPPATSAALLNGLAAASFAAAGPGFRKARSNARRLTKFG